jgi:hypothetical protein
MVGIYDDQIQAGNCNTVHTASEYAVLPALFCFFVISVPGGREACRLLEGNWLLMPCIAVAPIRRSLYCAFK